MFHRSIPTNSMCYYLQSPLVHCVVILVPFRPAPYELPGKQRSPEHGRRSSVAGQGKAPAFARLRGRVQGRLQARRAVWLGGRVLRVMESDGEEGTRGARSPGARRRSRGGREAAVLRNLTTVAGERRPKRRSRKFPENGEINPPMDLLNLI